MFCNFAILCYIMFKRRFLWVEVHQVAEEAVEEAPEATEE